MNKKLKKINIFAKQANSKINYGYIINQFYWDLSEIEKLEK